MDEIGRSIGIERVWDWDCTTGLKERRNRKLSGCKRGIKSYSSFSFSCEILNLKFKSTSRGRIIRAYLVNM